MLLTKTKSTIECVAIEPANLEFYWDRIKDYINRPLLHDPLNATSAEVYANIMNRTYILILVYEGKDKILAAQTLELIKSKNGLICNLVTTGGIELHKWQDELLDIVEQIARGYGCYSMTTRGRIGWLKKLKRNGFKPRVFIAEKVF